MNLFILILKILCISLFLAVSAYSEIINKIVINGNKRISDETVVMFANVSLKDQISNNELNLILKDLYQTNYFENVKVLLNENILTITVKEYPIIQKIEYTGVKSKTLLAKIISNSLIKNKSPFNLFSLNNEKNRINDKIKELGYYDAKLETFVETLDADLININFNIKLGDKDGK